MKEWAGGGVMKGFVKGFRKGFITGVRGAAACVCLPPLPGLGRVGSEEKGKAVCPKLAKGGAGIVEIVAAIGGAADGSTDAG